MGIVIVVVVVVLFGAVRSGCAPPARSCAGGGCCSDAFRALARQRPSYCIGCVPGRVPRAGHCASSLMELHPVVVFLAGLVILVVGGEMLLRGASRLAVMLDIRPIIIGLTVSIGTSTPELAVGALHGGDRGQGSAGGGQHRRDEHRQHPADPRPERTDRAAADTLLSRCASTSR
ncbi:MAG: hypothetical protein U1F17_09155 [Burkholderiaceae bacterium]